MKTILKTVVDLIIYYHLPFSTTRCSGIMLCIMCIVTFNHVVLLIISHSQSVKCLHLLNSFEYYVTDIGYLFWGILILS